MSKSSKYKVNFPESFTALITVKATEPGIVDIPIDMYESIPNAYLWMVPYGVYIPFWDAKWSPDNTEFALDFINGNWGK